MEPRVRAEGTAFRYPQNGHGLRPVSLAVRSGERLLIAGPSGCGKSTLARCLSGLIPHLYRGDLSGCVQLDGLDTAHTPLWQLAERAGLVFQNPAAQMLADTVEGEIVLGLENLGLDPAAIRERLEHALACFGLETLRDRAPQTLSGGEQQKLALAAVTARQPPVLVLDEPLSMLDGTAAADLVDHLATLADGGTSVIVCEHREEYLQGLPGLRQLVLTGSNGHPSPVLSGLGLNFSPGTGQQSRRAGRTSRPEQDSTDSIRRVKHRHRGQQARTSAAGQGAVAGRGMAPSPGAPEDLEFDEGERFQGLHHEAVGDRGDARTVLEVCALSVRLGGRPILRDLGCTLRGGEVVAVVGRNGVGKTTLLRALAGLQPHEGRVTVGGGERPDLGLVFQNPDLQLFNASVREEILYRVRDPDHSLYGELLSVLGLQAYEAVPPLLLSEGEKKRVALATVLMRKPRHGVLLDEPSLGQDAAHKERLVAVAQAVAQSGCLVVITTHDLPLAARADRLLLLGPQGFVADGPPGRVLRDGAAWAELGLSVPGWLQIPEMTAQEDGA